MALSAGSKGHVRIGMRRRLFRLHQAVGVAIAGVMVVIAATGSLLVFRGCAKVPPPRAPAVERPLGLEALLARAQAEAGAAPITDIGLPEAEGDPHVFYVDDEAETVLYLAGDGALIERRATAGGLMRALFKLHTGEIVGPPGQGLALATGLGTLALVVTGLGMIVSRRRARS